MNNDKIITFLCFFFLQCIFLSCAYSISIKLYPSCAMIGLLFDKNQVVRHWRLKNGEKKKTEKSETANQTYNVKVFPYEISFCIFNVKLNSRKMFIYISIDDMKLTWIYFRFVYFHFSELFCIAKDERCEIGFVHIGRANEKKNMYIEIYKS